MTVSGHQRNLTETLFPYEITAIFSSKFAVYENPQFNTAVYWAVLMYIIMHNLQYSEFFIYQLKILEITVCFLISVMIYVQ